MDLFRQLLVFLITICTNNLLSIYGQQLFIGDSCNLEIRGVGICKYVKHCPSAQQLIATGIRPQLCSFGREEPIVCCPRGRVLPRPWTTAGPLVSARPAPWTTARPPVTAKPAPRPPNPPPRPKPTTKGKSWQKCQEYAKEVYREIEIPLLTFHTEKVIEADCAQNDHHLSAGGVRCQPKEFPHMVALGYGDAPKINWLCGGSLISNRFVLTTATCIYSKERGRVKWIKLGDLNMAERRDYPSSQTIKVLKTLAHPRYKPTSFYHDIALLRLKTSVKMDAYVRPACLHTLPATPAGKIATATGWGVTNWSDAGLSQDLMKVHLQFHPAARCNETFKSLISSRSKLVNGFTEETMICAGDPQNRRDTCVGNSGDPLQLVLTEPYCMYSIVGLTSFGGRDCGESNTPAVYTRVSHYVPWIESVVWP